MQPQRWRLWEISPRWVGAAAGPRSEASPECGAAFYKASRDHQDCDGHMLLRPDQPSRLSVTGEAAAAVALLSNVVPAKPGFLKD